MRVIPCSDCGRPVSDTEIACPHCGCPVNISLDKMLKEKRKQALQAGNRNISSSGRSNSRFDLQMDSVKSGRKSNAAGKSRTSSTASARQRRTKSAKKRKYMRLILIAALFIVPLVLILLCLSKCSSVPDNLAQPIYSDNGYVYYANEEDDGRLYKAEYVDDELNNEQKLSEYRPTEMVLQSGWIYYTNHDRNNMIYRVNIYGLDESLVYNHSAKNLEVITGWLIFDNESENYEQYLLNLADIVTGEVSEAYPTEGTLDGIRLGSSGAAAENKDDNPTSQPEGSQVSSDNPASQPEDSQASSDNSAVSRDEPDSQPGQSSQPDVPAADFTASMKVSNSKLPWNLVLANKYNPLSADYDREIETATLQNGKKVDKRVRTRLNDMMADMQADISNCDIFVSSSYRTVATQQSLFERKIESLTATGMTKEEAGMKAVETVSKAGTSDHNTGLSVDFNDGIKSFSETKEYRWLQKNAYKYGFIERYPQSGEDATKYVWEPCHYRYVGNEAAQIIHDEGITLEEYIFKYYNGCVSAE